jgi:hypothetical protein
VLRGFGASQLDLSARREFHMNEKWGLQARVDAFNVLNHSNFYLTCFGLFKPSAVCDLEPCCARYHWNARLVLRKVRKRFIFASRCSTKAR